MTCLVHPEHNLSLSKDAFNCIWGQGIPQKKEKRRKREDMCGCLRAQLRVKNYKTGRYSRPTKPSKLRPLLWKWCSGGLGLSVPGKKTREAEGLCKPLPSQTRANAAARQPTGKETGDLWIAGWAGWRHEPRLNPNWPNKQVTLQRAPPALSPTTAAASVRGPGNPQRGTRPGASRPWAYLGQGVTKTFRARVPSRIAGWGTRRDGGCRNSRSPHPRNSPKSAGDLRRRLLPPQLLSLLPPRVTTKARLPSRAPISRERR